MIYRNTSEWIGEKPEKIALMENLLMENQAKFVKLATGIVEQKGK